MAAPVLSPASDDAPCARVDVLLESLPVGTVKVTVWRTYEAREAKVSGAIGIVVSGVVSVIDYEVPLDVDLSYRVQFFGASGGELGWSDSATTRVVSPHWGDGLERILIHNPLDPRSAVWVTPGAGFAAVVSRPTPGETRWGHGSRLGMVQSSTRRGITGVPLDVVTDTFEAGNRFDELFGTPDTPRLPILCVRIPGSLRFTRLPVMWFAAVLEQPSYPDMEMGTETVVWRLVADQVDRPVPTLVIPVLRRIDVAAYYPSRQAVLDANPTRLSVARRFEIAGSGGS